MAKWAEVFIKYQPSPNLQPISENTAVEFKKEKPEREERKKHGPSSRLHRRNNHWHLDI